MIILALFEKKNWVFIVNFLVKITIFGLKYLLNGPLHHDKKYVVYLNWFNLLISEEIENASQQIRNFEKIRK